jgi:hypothetical protein
MMLVAGHPDHRCDSHRQGRRCDLGCGIHIH